jgi:DNA helicase-2/ATP-dependent DNA helicase PcrA
MTRHPAVEERLAKLQVDQRRAATAPPGPVLCVAPAGSGKTTTLVARIAWLIDEGVPPETICAISFNRKAAEELRERVTLALEPQGPDLAKRVRIRTFHALGLELLREAGEPVEPLLDREEVLKTVRPEARSAERRRFDTVLSRFKLDLDVDPTAIEADPEAGPIARTYAAYEREIQRRGGLDFDDLVARSLRLLERNAAVLRLWRDRCAHLLVDESQDLDKAQLRLALLLAAPANRIFLVGDDDQSIYGWRLADVRRLLSLAETSLPGLTRVDLETNYRCPGSVLARAVRLVEHNRERFVKVIKAGPRAEGRCILAPSAADDVDRIGAIIDSWPADGGTRAVLARTNRELLPAVAAAIRRSMPFRAGDLILPIESPIVDDLLAGAREASAAGARGRDSALLAIAALPERARLPEGERLGEDDPRIERRSNAAALQGWAAPFRSIDDLAAAIESTRSLLASLRVDDAALSLATAHGTKGLEFDHVAVIGLDEGRFPSARSIADALEPERAMEEERRLAYVAWTRARRSRKLLDDPASPSPFLLEAFSQEELGLVSA